jgi:hypothetical protein
MDFGAIPYTAIVGASFNIIKRFILSWRQRHVTRTLIIPNDEIKTIVTNFLVKNSDFIVIDLDNSMSYIEFDEKEDVEKFQNNRVLFRRLIKKFFQYVVNNYGDEKIVYITKNIDNIDLYVKCYVLIPSTIYESLKKMPHNEVYTLRTATAKKLLFSSDNDILEHIQKWF